jgi:hypothetical protein
MVKIVYVHYNSPIYQTKRVFCTIVTSPQAWGGKCSEVSSNKLCRMSHYCIPFVGLISLSSRHLCSGARQR